MFSIAELLDTAKAKAGIESDYRLGKVIEKNHANISKWRTGLSLPDEDSIERLCKLSGDDPDLIAAQIQSRRASSEEARQLWQRVAMRLQTGLAHSAVFVFTIVLVALCAVSTPASAANSSIKAPSPVYIMLS